MGSDESGGLPVDADGSPDLPDMHPDARLIDKLHHPKFAVIEFGAEQFAYAELVKHAPLTDQREAREHGVSVRAQPIEGVKLGNTEFVFFVS